MDFAIFFFFSKLKFSLEQVVCVYERERERERERVWVVSVVPFLYVFMVHVCHL